MKMIEVMIIDYLMSKHIRGIDENVYAEVPLNPPDQYLVIQRIASTKENGIYSATITINAISQKSLLTAMQICHEVVDVMENMAAETDIYASRFDAAYNNTNPTTKEYRYQASFVFYF